MKKFSELQNRSKENQVNLNRFLNIAHRGASGHAPENTLVAYKMGREMHGDSIEIDLQMTKDGILIAMHDERVDRTTNGTGYIKDMTITEIKALDAGSWFNKAHPKKAKPSYEGLCVPTFEEVLEVFGEDSRYYIETKAPDVYPGMEKELVRILKKYNLPINQEYASNVIIQSFSEDSLQIVKKLNPIIPLIQLISYPIQATVSKAELAHIKSYAVGVGMNYKRIDQAYIRKVQEQELLIHPYTVNKREDMKRMIDWGVTGLFTNYPDVLNTLLKEKQAIMINDQL
ncbi:glycerophosphodiester phosphodiesterase [Planococcus versutus]|uniref:Glycerophosphodiester phosphodiesterase n=1 Tax=Planococcus versutus TaxID=1302659 RepID=A0A1B1RYZ3_9BACL|nr:glycerophosphodiester phosphodiesterase [Planococcus versutus]ANU26146.1 glycerophosphodiester phosphodiesterase [Planococcus versutus]